MSRSLRHDPRRCGRDEKSNCPACALEAYLDQFPASQRAMQAKKAKRARQAMPAPLPAKFLERLAAEIAEAADLFGPILLYLVEREIDKRAEAEAAAAETD